MGQVTVSALNNADSNYRPWVTPDPILAATCGYNKFDTLYFRLVDLLKVYSGHRFIHNLILLFVPKVGTSTNINSSTHCGNITYHFKKMGDNLIVMTRQ